MLYKNNGDIIFTPCLIILFVFLKQNRVAKNLKQLAKERIAKRLEQLAKDRKTAVETKPAESVDVKTKENQDNNNVELTKEHKPEGNSDNNINEKTEKTTELKPSDPYRLARPVDYEDYWYEDGGERYNEYDDELEEGFYYADDTTTDGSKAGGKPLGLPRPADYEDFWYEEDGVWYNEYDDDLEDGQFYEDQNANDSKPSVDEEKKRNEEEMRKEEKKKEDARAAEAKRVEAKRRADEDARKAKEEAARVAKEASKAAEEAAKKAQEASKNMMKGFSGMSGGMFGSNKPEQKKSSSFGFGGMFNAQEPQKKPQQPKPQEPKLQQPQQPKTQQTKAPQSKQFSKQEAQGAKPQLIKEPTSNGEVPKESRTIEKKPVTSVPKVEEKVLNSIWNAFISHSYIYCIVFLFSSQVLHYKNLALTGISQVLWFQNYYKDSINLQIYIKECK